MTLILRSMGARVGGAEGQDAGAPRPGLDLLYASAALGSESISTLAKLERREIERAPQKANSPIERNAARSGHPASEI